MATPHTSPAHVPPPVPSKFDIIPIHNSDVAAFMRCRRYWDWTSPARNNLRRAVQIHGINFPLWFGGGIHYALEQYYNPILSRDPVEAFQTWFSLQYEGGEVAESWLEYSYDINPEPIWRYNHPDGEPDTDSAPRAYNIRGLRDLHPNPDHEEFATHRELGIQMMTYYRDFAKVNDDFRVVAAESMFSIPLGFEWTDTREQSPNYGKKLEVHARGKRDAIVQSLVTDKYAIIDHKTAGKIDDAYLAKLEMDRQCGRYMWASQEEARLHDLPWTHIDHTIYQALWKKYPKPPTILANGITPSINRAEESCTAEMFADYVASAGLTAWFEGNEKAQSYYNWLVEAGNERFVHREVVRRNEHQLKTIGEEYKAVAMDMLNSPNIYPNPTGDFLCLTCAFRGPCLAVDDGGDWQDMLANGYERNMDR